ncbi:MAG: galactose mutarotase [Lentisphaerae bacterium]|nr:galactose mutarotase [Lentisphaerota bacterium]
MRGRVRSFGKLADGREAKVYRLRGVGGLILDISDYGGRLVRCYAPDRHGNLADVTLGWNTAAEYEKYGFSAGTLIGRYGNRIADGKFTLDGKEYQLPVNENKAARHCNLHGGPEGWDKKIWNVKPLRMGPIQGLELTYVSKDGEMGFPGTVTCKVTYKVMPNNVWTIDYEATTDKPTVLNLTHHSYWNLAGESSGNVLDQELKIFADKYTQTTAGLIPTKDAPVAGTGFDFTEMRAIGAKADLMKADASLAPMDNWYDHNFVLRGENGKLKQAAFMRDPASGRTLEIWTTEPCMQMYGAQNMTDALPAKAAGKNLCQFAGVALETQHYPDSPNHPEFPSTVLRPGETFRSRTEYRFGVEK